MLKDLWLPFCVAFNEIFDTPPIINFMLFFGVLGSAYEHGSPVHEYIEIALAVVFVLLFIVRFIERLIIRESE